MMTTYLEYHLNHGYIHNWLVAGPHALQIQDLESYSGEEEIIRRHVYQRLPETFRPQAPQLDELPVDRADVEVGGRRLAWRYLRCMDDHLVDLSVTVPLWNLLTAWAHTVLKLPS